MSASSVLLLFLIELGVADLWEIRVHLRQRVARVLAGTTGIN
jgi:hypothetical protein